MQRVERKGLIVDSVETAPLVVPSPREATGPAERIMFAELHRIGEYGVDQLLARIDGNHHGDDESKNAADEARRSAKRLVDQWHDVVMKSSDYRVVTGWMERLEQHVMSLPDGSKLRGKYDEVCAHYFEVARPDADPSTVGLPVS